MAADSISKLRAGNWVHHKHHIKPFGTVIQVHPMGRLTISVSWHALPCNPGDSNGEYQEADLIKVYDFGGAGPTSG